MKEYTIFANAAHCEFVKELLHLLELDDRFKVDFDGEAIHITETEDKIKEGEFTWGTF